MRRLFIAIAAAAVMLIAGDARAQFAEGLPADRADYTQTQTVPGASKIGSPTFVQVAKNSGGVIDIGQAFSTVLEPYVNAIVQALILAGVTYLGNWLRTKYKVEVDQKHREALTAFLQNQASSLIADGAVSLQGKKINVDNAQLANAASAVLTRIPDAAKHFGLTPDVVAGKIVDAIPQIAAGARMIAQAHAAEQAAPAPVLP